MSAAEPSPAGGTGRTDPRDRVPLGEKLAYASSEVPNFLGSFLPVMLSKQVFHMSMGISPTLVSLTLALFRVVDAFTDPLVGWWSDRFRSRFGRRRPFMAMGVVTMAVTLPLLFLVDRSWGAYGVMAWFLAAGILLGFANTLFNIPYQSLLLEMTPDYHERTSITAFRSIAAKVMGIAVGWLWALTQLPIFADPVTGTPDTLRGAQALSWVAAGLILLTGFIPVWGCRERAYRVAAQRPPEPFWQGLQRSLASRPFRLLLLTAFLLKVPDLVGGMSAYLNNYYFFRGDQRQASVLTGWAYTAAQVVAFASVPVVLLVSRRIGKEATLRWILWGYVLLSISYWFIYSQREMPYLTLIPALFNGPLTTGLWMVLPSMVADAVDDDERLSGERREGTFSAIFSWVLKFGSTLMIALSGPILDLVGFDVARGGDQPEEVFTRMRWLLVAVPLVAVVIQLWILRRYPLNEATARETRALLEARRGRLDGESTAPLS